MDFAKIRSLGRSNNRIGAFRLGKYLRVYFMRSIYGGYVHGGQRRKCNGSKWTTEIYFRSCVSTFYSANVQWDGIPVGEQSTGIHHCSAFAGAVVVVCFWGED